MRSFRLNPWTKGQNTVDDARGKIFQLPGEGEAPAQATSLINCDVDHEGIVSRRAGLEEALALTAGKALFSGAGLLLCHDSSTIRLINPVARTASTVVSGLSGTNPVVFVEHDGQVFWTDQEKMGRIEADGTATNWGMVIPVAPVVAATSGTLDAGTYLVAVRLVDGNGVLGAATPASTVTLNGSQDFTVNVTSPDSSATHVRIYASVVNSPDLWFCKQVAIGALPATISNVLTAADNSSEPLAGVGKDAPPLGMVGLSSWGGSLVGWKQNTDGDWFLFRSLGNNHHLFDLVMTAAEQEFAIKGVAGSEAGPLFIATQRGLYRYTGKPRTDSWKRKRMDYRTYAKGNLLAAGSKLELLGKPREVEGRIAIFASEDGPVFGMPDGSIDIPLFGQDRYDVNGKTAHLVLAESGEFYQLLTLLV